MGRTARKGEIIMDHYFISINGSPTPKNQLVQDVVNDQD